MAREDGVSRAESVQYGAQACFIVMSSSKNTSLFLSPLPPSLLPLCVCVCVCLQIKGYFTSYQRSKISIWQKKNC